MRLVVIEISLASVFVCTTLRFQVGSMNRDRGFWKAYLVAKLTRLKTEQERLHREAYSFSFYLFDPGRWFVPDSSQPGQTREPAVR